MSIANELKQIAKELQAELKDLDKFKELDTWHRLDNIQRRLDKCCLATLSDEQRERINSIINETPQGR